MKFISPAEARRSVFPRSPKEVLLWLSNPIYLLNLRRKEKGEFPYWERWSSLSLHHLHSKSKNSYAMFVEWQKKPLLVLKKIQPTFTSYGVKLMDLWGVIYINERGKEYMHADWSGAHFGEAYSTDVSAGSPATKYDRDQEKKKEILSHAIQHLKEGGKWHWDQRTVKRYLSLLMEMKRDVKRGRI